MHRAGVYKFIIYQEYKLAYLLNPVASVPGLLIAVVLRETI